MTDSNFTYSESNYKRPYNTNEFYQQIITDVGKNLGRNLTSGEQRQVTSFIRKLDPNLLTPAYKKKTIPIMVTTLVDEFKTYQCADAIYNDSQQTIRDMIGISSESNTIHGIYDNPSFVLQNAQDTPVHNPESDNTHFPPETKVPESKKDSIDKLLGMSDANEFVRLMNPQSQQKNNYILFDSRYREVSNQSEESITKFTWGYAQGMQSSNDGTVNIIGNNTRDLIGMRIYPFRIPYSSTADNKYSRISLFVESFASQAFVAHERRKFHFMLKSSIDSGFIELDTDQFNDGWFYFETPITAVPTLTISFGNPLEPITFDRDRDFCSIDYFSVAPATLITTEKTHNLVNGDRVYFSKFDVGPVSPLLNDQKIINDNIKLGVNSESGFLVTIISPTTFSIPFNTSAIQNPIAGIRPIVFYGSKRMFIPMQLLYINPLR